jgi:hypothetical protein
MLHTLPRIATLAEVIQLSVAPVFLLAGVGTTLNVLASRIARIIDRARLMEDRLLSATEAQAAELHDRLRVLSKRAALISRAIGLCVLSGLLVALVVATLFIAAALQINLAIPIAVGFVIALLSLSLSLVYFLREIVIANSMMTFGGVKPPKKRQG